MNKKNAFTLAEVLITLAIIGMVAAMTIPTIVATTQKKELAINLKKAYSTFNQAMKLIMIDYGCTDLYCTDIASGCCACAPAASRLLERTSAHWTSRCRPSR